MGCFVAVFYSADICASDLQMLISSVVVEVAAGTVVILQPDDAAPALLHVTAMVVVMQIPTTIPAIAAILIAVPRFVNL